MIDKALLCQVQVAFSCFDIIVAEKIFDLVNINTSITKVSGPAMSQRMWCGFLKYTGLTQCSLEYLLNRPGAVS